MQSKKLKDLLSDLVEIVKTAILRGDWRVDGACDPYKSLDRIRAALHQHGEK